MKQKQGESGRHIVDILFVLALFGVFAASALMLVTLGANVYKQTTADMSRNFSERTAYSYVTEKIRQNDTADAISIEEIDGVQALVFTKRAGEETYCTYLYFYDGHLKELYARKDFFAGNDILSAGQNILALTGLSMEECQSGLIRLTLEAEGSNPVTIYATVRSDLP